jgi:hypothetical protein
VRVPILGVNHQIQWVRIWSWSSSGELERFERDQKDRFRGILRKSIAEREVQFVAEPSLLSFPGLRVRNRKFRALSSGYTSLAARETGQPKL